MITPQSFALDNFSCQLDESSIQKFIDESAQKFIDDNIQKLLGDTSELPTGQISIPINEGRTELVIKEAKDSTIHFGKLLEEYVLTKYSELINTIFSNEIIVAFAVRDDALKSDFSIVRNNVKLHVRSFVASSDSEQRIPRLHLERFGMRLFGIIIEHINENEIPEKIPFDFIGKQFVFSYCGPEKKSFHIEEFAPRVIEVDPSIDESQSIQPKSTKSNKISPNLIPKPVFELIKSIKRTTRDIDVFETSRHVSFRSTNQTKGDSAIWSRIMDIAYDKSNSYDSSSLVSLKEELSKFNGDWQYSSSENTYYISSSNELISFPKQKIWDKFISKLEEF